VLVEQQAQPVLDDDHDNYTVDDDFIDDHECRTIVDANDYHSRLVALSVGVRRRLGVVGCRVVDGLDE
jgi:hypothetical protein